MIDSSSHIAAQQIFSQNLLDHAKLKSLDYAQPASQAEKPAGAKAFDNVVGRLIKEVDQKEKVALEETNKMLLGQTDNIHQSMIAMQEAGMAFNLMVEVRNKLLESYQELIKMPV